MENEQNDGPPPRRVHVREEVSLRYVRVRRAHKGGGSGGGRYFKNIRKGKREKKKLR